MERANAHQRREIVNFFLMSSVGDGRRSVLGHPGERSDFGKE
jgi:hypothetical protein